ncbi:MAG: hypothetical protein KGH94_05280 [Candidatus Micrarchaeota archaeon]|nr:hypothetical protein [Candidatus Micrarchaeota archaeon]
MADPLALTTYGVQREFKLGGLTLGFTDSEGNQVLQSKGRIAVTQQPIRTMDGRTLGTVTHKILAMTPEYDLHEGGPNDKVLSVIKVPMQLFGGGGLRTVDIKDGDGTTIAIANGNFLDMNFDIRDSQGNAVATVSRDLGKNPGLLQKFAAFTRNSYVINIIDSKNVPTLVLLGFLVVVEILLNQSKGSSPGLIGGGIGGVGGVGMGGGFGGIKL